MWTVCVYMQSEIHVVEVCLLTNYIRDRDYKRRLKDILLMMLFAMKEHVK